MLLALSLSAALATTQATWPPYGVAPDCPEVEATAPEIWLMTMSATEPPFSWMAHTAMLVRSPGAADGKVYSFGAFHGEQIRREPLETLVAGTLPVSWYNRSEAKAMAKFSGQDRTVLIQKLDLDTDALRRLYRGLIQAARRDAEPFHWRDYNCSTYARDLIDQATGGRLRAALSTPAPMTPRQEVLRHLGPHTWAWFLWNYAAGAGADDAQDRWAAASVPVRLAEGVADAGLVASACALHRGHDWPAPEGPKHTAAALACGLLWAGLALLGGRRGPERFAGGAAIAGLGLFAGLIGTASAILWAVSRLEVTHSNHNLWLANPATLLLVGVGVAWARRGPSRGGGGGWDQRAALGLAGAAAFGCLGEVLPGRGQQNGEVIALFLPPLLACGWVAWRQRA